VSALIGAGLRTTRDECRGAERKKVKRVVGLLEDASAAFSRARRAGSGARKVAAQVARGVQAIDAASAGLAKVQRKVSQGCANALSDAVRASDAGAACIRGYLAEGNRTRPAT
jgi:hypothetical protein